MEVFDPTHLPHVSSSIHCLMSAGGATGPDVSEWKLLVKPLHAGGEQALLATPIDSINRFLL